MTILERLDAKMARLDAEIDRVQAAAQETVRQLRGERTSLAKTRRELEKLTDPDGLVEAIKQHD